MISKDDIKKLDINALKKELGKMKQELFNLRIGGEVKDFSQFKKLKAGVARCSTFLTQKENKS